MPHTKNTAEFNSIVSDNYMERGERIFGAVLLLEARLENCCMTLVFNSRPYFDFEPTSNRKNVENKSSTSFFLNLVRGKANWQEIIENKGYGIIPINKQFDSLSVCLMEIYPKNTNLDETDMIQFVWKRWLDEMNIKETDFIPHTSIPKMEGQIDNYIANNK